MEKSPSLPRWSLAALCLGHAAVFAWSAWTLPWGQWTVFAACCAALSLMHVATASLAALGARPLAVAWRIQSLAALAFLIYMGWSLLTSALYLNAVYESLGPAVGAIMVASFGLVVLVTLPLACWGLASTGGVRWTRRSSAGLALLAALGGLQIASLRQVAQGVELVGDEALPHIERALEDAFASVETFKKRPPSIKTRRSALCEAPLDEGALTLIFTFNDRRAKPARPLTRCVQVKDAAQLSASAKALVEAHAIKGFVKVDLITRRFELPQGEGLMAAMSFRPGLDGACRGQRCLMPWQLVANEVFDTHNPLSNWRKFRSGVSMRTLKRLIRKGNPEGDALARIESVGWVLDRRGRLVREGRLKRAGAAATPEVVAASTSAAHAYILGSQRDDGQFRYILNPMTGQSVDAPFSLPRQAGTTMVMCELGGSGPANLKAVGRSLELLASMERQVGEGGAGFLLPPEHDPGKPVALGSTALTLVALLKCRPLVGEAHDARIGRLLRAILRSQRPEGNFHHLFDAATGAPAVDRGGRLYIDGQAIYALVLAEAVGQEAPGQWPARDEIHAAVQRAMDHFGRDYWSHFAGRFFFFEEHWHCLAAAAALGHHRHEAYEDFCLDFITYRQRLQHDEGSDVHADYVGGVGYGNLSPPRNTATTGFGEPLAAAIQIKRARGLNTEREEHLMRLSMDFLVRNQWSADTCFACSRRADPEGGFSQTMITLPIRIDYVQHAWASIGHGARVLDEGLGR